MRFIFLIIYKFLEAWAVLVIIFSNIVTWINKPILIHMQGGEGIQLYPLRGGVHGNLFNAVFPVPSRGPSEWINIKDSLQIAGWLILVCVFRIKVWLTKSTSPIVKGISNFQVETSSIIPQATSLLKDFTRKGRTSQGPFWGQIVTRSLFQCKNQKSTPYTEFLFFFCFL